MGQAFDKDGAILSEMYGHTKREVFDTLIEKHPDAAEIRIRSVDGSGAGSGLIEMPRYVCHKEVHALKIGGITFDVDVAQCNGRETDGTATILPSEVGYAPFKVSAAYVRKHEPHVGGYYVVYKDGYLSFSPADAFEEGYRRL